MNNWSDSARLWIYVSDKKFSEGQVNELNDLLKSFCREWSAHGMQLAADAEIRYNQIIILSVDETKAGASGCSIDKSVHFIQSLEEKFSVHLFNRMLVPVMIGDELRVETPEKISGFFSTQKINESTPVFNTLAATRKELDEMPFVPLRESWIFSRMPEKAFSE